MLKRYNCRPHQAELTLAHLLQRKTEMRKGARLSRTSISKLLIVLVFTLGYADAQVSVLTQRNDNSRSGLNANETVLAPSNVNTPNFGKLFSLAVDGRVFGQPLYVPNLSIGGGTHNVVFIATEHDSIYAYDADGLVTRPLWTANLAALGCPAGYACTSVPASDNSTSDLVPEVGITGTPVIDSSTGTLYAVAKTKEVVSNQTNYVYRLHALDITSGVERAGSPVTIQGQVAGTGTPNSNGNLVFSPLYSLQRAALLLVNNGIYIGFGSWGDVDLWHGWIFGYAKSSLQQSGVFSTTPNGTEGHGGVWMHGTGLAANASGYIYFSTGNGAFDGISNFGDSILKLSTPGLTVVDYFTPYNQQAFDTGDLDIAAGGNVLLPDIAGTSQHPHTMIGCAKNGAIYVLDRDNLGQFNSLGDTQIIQELLNVIGATFVDPNSTAYVDNCFTTPAYWQGHVYFGGVDDYLKMFNVNGGLLTTSAASQSTTTYQFPGTTVSISANGSTNGIVWAIENAGTKAIDESGSAAVLHAYDANNLANELYNSSQVTSDNAGAPVKFTVPTIANGKVYVGTQNSVAVFGIFSSAKTPAPQISPAGGIYTGSVSITITDSAPSAAIYYTTDGSTPTSSSTQYSGTIAISSTTTLKAIAIAPEYTTSALSTTIFTIESSSRTIAYGAGFTGTGMSLDGSATYSGSRLRLTNGGFNEAASAFYSTAVNIQSFTTDFWILQTNGGYKSADGMAIVIQGAGLTAIGSAGGGLGYGSDTPGGAPGIGKSVAVKFDLYDNAGEGTNSTGLYTNGASPTIPAITITNVDLHSEDTLAVHMTYDGTTLAMTLTDTVTGATFTNSWTINIPTTVGGNTAYVGFTGGTGGATATQDVLYWAFTATGVQSQAATPTFSPAAGIYTSAQKVTISDTTTGGAIYYRTDGTTPTTSSAVYSAPISVSTTTTIKAIAAASGYTNSALGSATYAIQPAAATRTTLVSSMNPSVSGKSVSFTATVSSSAGTPTGKVQFFNGTTVLAILTLTSGSARYTTSKLPPGANSITAVYEGDSNNSGSTSSPVNQFVLAATTIVLTSTPNPSIYGQAVIFTATVTSSIGAPPPNGETVTFMKGTTVLGTGTLSGGSASFTTASLTGGTTAVAAVYGGDSQFGSSKSKAVSQVVNKATTTTALASSLNPSTYGQSVTFTASVTSGFSGTPSGSVTFYDGTTALKTASLSGGAAKFTTKTLASGTHNITATYNGSASFSGSSASLTQTVH